MWSVVPHTMHQNMHYLPEFSTWTESDGELTCRADLRSCLLAYHRGVRKRKAHTRCCLEKSQHKLRTLTYRGSRLGQEGIADKVDTQYGRYAC